MRYKFKIKQMQEMAQKHDGYCLSWNFISLYSKLTWQCSKGHVWRTTPKIVSNGHWCPKCAYRLRSQNRIKYSINDMQLLACKRKGICLSENYLGYNKKLTWKCCDGHIWETIPDNIFQGKWCPKCSKNKHFTEEKCRFIAEQITGLNFPSRRDVLGNGYEIDMYNEEHKIAIEYNGIQHYQFVKGFHGNLKGWQEQRYRDAKKKELIEENEIRFLIISHRDSKSDDNLVKIIHNFLSSYIQCRSKVNFKKFYQNLSSLNELKKIAKSHGGKCLSRQYINCETKCTFICRKAHVFSSEPRHIKSGHWCPECAKKTMGPRKWGIDDVKSLAQSRGGQCLSKIYENNKSKLQWQCQNGHKWSAAFGDIKSGTWCPVCYRVKFRAINILKSVETHDC